MKKNLLFLFILVIFGQTPSLSCMKITRIEGKDVKAYVPPEVLAQILEYLKPNK